MPSLSPFLLPAAFVVAACAFGCTPVRSEVTVACSRDGQCPADGKHFCNLVKLVCEACDGTCAQTVDAAGGGEVSLASAPTGVDAAVVDAADVAATGGETVADTAAADVTADAN